MALTKVTEKGIKEETVTTGNVKDGEIANVDISPSAAIADTKLATISSSIVGVTALTPQPGSSGVFLAGNNTWAAIDTSQADTNAFNISLLGFKMAVNESLTVFNLLDGVVDEFHDESGTDESEGSNDTYNSSSDYYINSTQPDGLALSYSAGFTMTTITEPDTSTAGTNPGVEVGTFGSYTVPSGITSVNIKVWGAAGGGSPADTYYGPDPSKQPGGGGGYAEGTLGTSGESVLYLNAGEGGEAGPGSEPGYKNHGNGRGEGGGGAGLSGVFANDLGPLNSPFDNPSSPQYSVPQAYVIAGSGGGAGSCFSGGAGGGLIGDKAGDGEQVSLSGAAGGGGDQEQGGQGGEGNPSSNDATTGDLFSGGAAAHPTPSAGVGGGGAGFYGGGGGAYRVPGENLSGAGGGGSSYHGHPQITSGSTEAGCVASGGGTADPAYVACTNEGVDGAVGEDGYVLINVINPAAATSTSIISNAFSAGSVPTTSRIVVFEENVDTPTLNTDIIASVSRDGGSTFTNATLTDSGYVTGSSGQRILTGQATISGQPSGQSMRWKLALANNQVKIHGVSLSWA